MEQEDNSEDDPLAELETLPEEDDVIPEECGLGDSDVESGGACCTSLSGRWGVPNRKPLVGKRMWITGNNGQCPRNQR